MRTKTTTTTTDASAEDRRRVQGIEDNNGGGSGFTTGPVDWQRQRSVDFLAFRLITVTLSRLCLVAVLFWYFSSDSFFFRPLHEILSVLQSCGKYVCTKCTLTLPMYPLRTGELKTMSYCDQ